MEQMGCTPQDLHHVQTISMMDVQLTHQNNDLEFIINTHAVRLGRIADVSTKYAKRAEELKLSATKQQSA